MVKNQSCTGNKPITVMCKYELEIMLWIILFNYVENNEFVLLNVVMEAMVKMKVWCEYAKLLNIESYLW